MPHTHVSPCCSGLVLLLLTMSMGCNSITGHHGLPRITLANPAASGSERVLPVSEQQEWRESRSKTAPATPQGPQDDATVIDLAETVETAPQRSPLTIPGAAPAPHAVSPADARTGYVRIGAESSGGLTGTGTVSGPQPAVSPQNALNFVPIGTICGDATCLPSCIHAQQIGTLTDRIRKLETTQERSLESIAALTKSLSDANQNVRSLTASVQHWRTEVTRLESTMKSQHEADIAALTQISELLGAAVDTELADSGPDDAAEAGDLR